MKRFSPLLFALATAFFSTSLLAQGFDPSTAVDIPSSIGHGTELEHVDLESGALVVRIPLLHLKGRGIDTDIVASYNSKVWSSRLYVDPYNGWQLSEDYGQAGGGWYFGFPAMTSSPTGGVACDPGDCSGFQIFLEQIHRNDGSSISLASQVGYLGTSGTIFSYDGSFIAPEGGNLSSPDGTKIGGSAYQDSSGNWHYTQVQEDTNGNTITCTFDSPKTCTDTVGRVITFTFTSNAELITYPDDNGIQQTITINMSAAAVTYPWLDGENICGHPLVFNCVWPDGGGPVVSNIVFPNGTSYQFDYLDNGDGTTSGELTKLILPTGGYIRYAYTSEAPAGSEVSQASNRVIRSRFISPDGTAASEQAWTYNITGGTTASVTDPQGNVEQETFSATTAGPDAWAASSFPPVLPVPLPTQSKFTDASGTLLKQVDRQWSYDYNPAYSIYNPYYSSYHFSGNPEITQETTTLGGSPQQAIKTYSYSSYGNVSQEDDYDWAPQGQYGTLLRAASTAYLADSSGSAYGPSGAYILNRPTTKTIYGNCGNSYGTCSTATFIYDAYSSGGLNSGLAPTSSIVGHDYQNFSAANTLRGNLTRVTYGPGVNGGSSSSDTSYNDLGDVTGKMDGNGNIVTVDYTDNYSGSQQPSGPTLAFATKITKPSTNGISHVDRFQYYLNSGMGAASCGENFSASLACTTALALPQSDYAWLSYDSINRPTSIHFGDGGGTAFSYNDLPLATTVVETKALSGSQSIVSTTAYDGLGRVYRSILTDPQGNDYVYTTYDTLGRTQSVSNPYRSPAAAGDPPPGTTSYAYDGLGRKILVCNPDNGINGSCVAGNSYTQTVYSGSSVTTYDESRNSWQRTTDARGNVVGLVEQAGGLNLQTNYTYDALNNLLAVNQLGTSGEAPRGRSFRYDSLSRLLTSTNPETGTICYGVWSGGSCSSGYDSNGNLTKKTDARNITVSYYYDALNRLTARTYSDGTVSSCYQYDSSAITGSLGRLTNEWTQNGVCNTGLPSNPKSAYSILSYDATGRILQDKRCAWQQLCTAQTYRPMNYTYDLAGNRTSLGDGISGRSFLTPYDNAGRVSGLSTTLAGGSMVPLFTVNSYSPVGLTGATLGSMSLQRTYDNRVRPTGETVTAP